MLGSRSRDSLAILMAGYIVQEDELLASDGPPESGVRRRSELHREAEAGCDATAPDRTTQRSEEPVRRSGLRLLQRRAAGRGFGAGGDV